MKFALPVRAVAGQDTDWLGMDICTKALPGALLAVSYLVSNYKLQVRQTKNEDSMAVSFLGKCLALSRCLEASPDILSQLGWYLVGRTFTTFICYHE